MFSIVGGEEGSFDGTLVMVSGAVLGLTYRSTCKGRDAGSQWGTALSTHLNEHDSGGHRDNETTEVSFASRCS